MPDDKPYLISVPPGLIPQVDPDVNSGTRKLPPVQLSAPAPASVPVARPGGQGVPLPSVPPRAAAVHGAAPLAEAADGAPPAEPQSARRWVLTLIDGTRHPIDRAVVVGRNPSAAGGAGIADAAVLALSDPQRSVSKTHAVFSVRDGELTVRDLDSTNGVFIRTAAGEQKVAPGADETVPNGAVVMLGRFELRAASD